MPPGQVIECKVASRGLEGPLGAFLVDLAAAGEEEWFHPHALDDAGARAVCEHEGEDVYYVVVQGAAVLGYGFLRGWDDGFDVPSLGIAVHPDARGRGIGRMLMEQLHLAARRHGSRRVRLRVYPDNTAAVSLYRSLGYEFGDEEDGQLVGFLELE